MPLPDDFVQSLEFVHPRDLAKMLLEKQRPSGGKLLRMTNEVKPVDLFCYLGARFGQPNGIQNFYRNDDSDNLFHWDWTLRHAHGLITFLGLNFRTEIQLVDGGHYTAVETEELAEQIKADIAKRGQEIAPVRAALEHWTEFVNPYQRIRQSIDGLLEELDSLSLDPTSDRIDTPWEEDDIEQAQAKWRAVALRYSKAHGLCFGIRSMLPVMAESFVNFVIFVLLRPEIRGDQRLTDNLFRQPIDIRIKSLPLNCIGFERQPDYASEVCRSYHRLVNERNDLLHGNMVIDKLKFNDVFFWGKVPVFKEYRTVWQRTLETHGKAVGLGLIQDEVATVDAMREYVLSCMHEEPRELVRRMLQRFELGWNKKTQRVGVLFPNWLVDVKTVMREQHPVDGEGTGSPTQQ